MRRILKTGLGALAISAVFTGLWAAPASAHPVNQGSDEATHSYDGTFLEYCDYESDGHSVWVNYYTDASTSMRSTASVNGFNQCGQYYFDSVLTNLRVVEDNPASSTNYYGRWHDYPVAGN
ncbi:hypothetical protein AB0I95_22990 [Micromonospora sp. NPDC049751]|uniref:hypothetical protein n=1 Tax=unclassified Micromonospora TaxID=2617518 RepID=UPI00340F9228